MNSFFAIPAATAIWLPGDANHGLKKHQNLKYGLPI